MTPKYFTIFHSLFSDIARGMVGDLQSHGITQENMEVVTQGASWRIEQRNIVVRTLDALLYGSVDASGLPRFPVPPMYLAAVIAFFVQPHNFQRAAAWCERPAGHIEFDVDPTVEVIENDAFPAHKLFALILHARQVWNTDSQEFIAEFNSRTGYLIGNARPLEEDNGTSA